MLVLLPPSEGKTPAETDTPFDLSRVEPFSGELEGPRSLVLENLIEVSGRDDALEVLKVGKTIAYEVRANRTLPAANVAPAYQIYSGVLFEAGEINRRGRAYEPSENFEVLVQSALFGVVDLASQIPAYRLSMDTKLGELGNLGTWWKKQLGELMDGKARHRIVVDGRSGAYQKAWPGVSGEHDLIRVNAVRVRNGKRSVVSHNAKRYRGILAGALMDRAGEVEDSIDFVVDTARSLKDHADFSDVEVHQKNGYLELVLVTA
ncbi:MAG: peroxide stress protein YaaA [Actinomycetaceae bacterium]|nr:peroxide stress protein YaaA [Actinomycetaceae bacterium]